MEQTRRRIPGATAGKLLDLRREEKSLHRSGHGRAHCGGSPLCPRLSSALCFFGHLLFWLPIAFHLSYSNPFGLADAATSGRLHGLKMSFKEIGHGGFGLFAELRKSPSDLTKGSADSVQDRAGG